MLKANPGASAPASSIAAEAASTESIRVWVDDLIPALLWGEAA